MIPEHIATPLARALMIFLLAALAAEIVCIPLYLLMRR